MLIQLNFIIIQPGLQNGEKTSHFLPFGILLYIHLNTLLTNLGLFGFIVRMLVNNFYITKTNPNR